MQDRLEYIKIKKIVIFPSSQKSCINSDPVILNLLPNQKYRIIKYTYSVDWIEEFDTDIMEINFHNVIKRTNSQSSLAYVYTVLHFVSIVYRCFHNSY